MFSGMPPLFFIVVLPLLVLGLIGYVVSSITGWFQGRCLRAELRGLGILCDHLNGPDLQLLHAETGLKMIESAKRETA